MILLVSIIIGFIAAAVTEIDIVQNYPGQFKDSGGVRTVRMPAEAIVENFEIELGDKVQKGDLLVDVDTRSQEAELSSLLEQRQSLCEQLVDAQTILAVHAAHVASSSIVESIDGYSCGQPTAAGQARADALSRQLSLERQVLQAELIRLTADKETLSQQLETAQEQLVMAQAALERHASLLAEGLSLQGTVDDVRQRVLVQERDILQLRQTGDALDERLATAELLLETDAQNAYGLALENFASARQAVESQDQQIEVLRLALERLSNIQAPINGRVVALQTQLAGTGAGAGEELLAIAPENGELSVELMVSAASIGFVEIGDQVSIRVNTYPYQRYGLLIGEIQSVALGNSDGGEEAAGILTAQIVDFSSFTLDPSVALRNGLTVDASVKVGRRTVLSYFTDPITDGLRKSLNEN